MTMQTFVWSDVGGAGVTSDAYGEIRKQPHVYEFNLCVMNYIKNVLSNCDVEVMIQYNNITC